MTEAAIDARPGEGRSNVGVVAGRERIACAKPMDFAALLAQARIGYLLNAP